MGKEIRTRMCILDVDYVIDDDKNTIRIWGKTEDGKTIVAIDTVSYTHLTLPTN